MQITMYSVGMTVLWSSVLIILFSFLRTKYRFIDVCSVSGIVILFMFCIVRLAVPIEVPWIRVVSSKHIYSAIYRVLNIRVLHWQDTDFLIYHLLLVVWLAVFAVQLIRLIADGVRLSGWIRQLDHCVDKRTEDILAGLKLEDPHPMDVRIIKTGQISVPVNAGLLKKYIIVPDNEYTDKELYYILKHEYTHLKNHDQWVYLLINILCAVYWWNPCVYLLKNNLSDSFELRCDHMVVAGMDGDGWADYLATLGRVYSERNNNRIPIKNEMGMLGTNATAGKLLNERARVLLAEYEHGYRTYGKGIALAMAAIVTVLSYSFIFQSKFESPMDEIENNEGIYLIEMGESYIWIDSSGDYHLHMSEDIDEPLNENDAHELINKGIELRN